LNIQPRKRVTIREVAEYAGVSIGAVSRVLHGRGDSIRVSETTAERIREAAKALRYQPNPIARTLRGGKTYSLAIGGPHKLEFALGGTQAYVMDRLMREALNSGYSLCFTPDLIHAEHAAELAQGRYEGVVWLPGTFSCEGDGPLSNKIPQIGILYDAVVSHSGVFLASTDYRPAMKQLMLEASSKGFNQVVTVVNADCMHKAWPAFLEDEMAELCEQTGVTWKQDPHEGASPERTLEDIKGKDSFVILPSDEIALEWIRLAKLDGMRIPEDVSIVSIGSVPGSALLTPALSAIKVPFEKLCQIGIDFLVENETVHAESPELIQTWFESRGTLGSRNG